MISGFKGLWKLYSAEIIYILLSILISISFYIKSIEAEFFTIAYTLINSIYSLYKANSFNNKEKYVKNKEAMSSFFMEIYFESLVLELPKKFSDIDRNYGNETEYNIEVFLEEISEIMNRSRFYEFFNEEHYIKVYSQLMKIEDFIMIEIMNEGISSGLFEKNPYLYNQKINQLKCEVKMFYNDIMQLYLL